jgi:hypothetical protein
MLDDRAQRAAPEPISLGSTHCRLGHLPRATAMKTTRPLTWFSRACSIAAVLCFFTGLLHAQHFTVYDLIAARGKGVHGNPLVHGKVTEDLNPD